MQVHNCYLWFDETICYIRCQFSISKDQSKGISSFLSDVVLFFISLVFVKSMPIEKRSHTIEDFFNKKQKSNKDGSASTTSNDISDFLYDRYFP